MDAFMDQSAAGVRIVARAWAGELPLTVTSIA
jgi:hypothetical protein